MICIYFHKDFDGICSAAVFAEYICSIDRGKTPAFIGVDYDLKKEWADGPLHKPSAVVDFLYHPDAEWWFDHHETTFVRRDWELSFRPDTKHVWGTEYKSCPRLVVDAVPDRALQRHLLTRFGEWLDWSDVIDSASYSSAQQVVECQEPALQVNSTLSQDTSGDYLTFLIGLIRQTSVQVAAAHEEVQKRFRSFRKWQSKAITVIQKTASVSKHVAYLDLARHSRYFHRYAVYYLWPEVAYQVVLYKSGQLYKLTVAANPWKESPGPDLGAICQQYGGGGHPVVAGILVKSRKQALRIAAEICQVLRGDSSFHQQLTLRQAVPASSK